MAIRTMTFCDIADAECISSRFIRKGLFAPDEEKPKSGIFGFLIVFPRAFVACQS